MVMSVLRKAIYGKDLDENYVTAHSGSSIPHPVSEAEWLTYDDGFYNEMSGGYKLIETPPDDMAKIEELLQVEPGFFASPYVIKTKEEHCNKCGRQNNFLDVVATGLRVHKPAFLVDVFTGKFGHVINTQQQQLCICYGCAAVLPPNATKRSSPKPLSSEAIAAGKKRAFYEFS